MSKIFFLIRFLEHDNHKEMVIKQKLTIIKYRKIKQNAIYWQKIKNFLHVGMKIIL